MLKFIPKWTRDGEISLNVVSTLVSVLDLLKSVDFIVPRIADGLGEYWPVFCLLLAALVSVLKTASFFFCVMNSCQVGD
jgi:hypothetical protein